MCLEGNAAIYVGGPYDSYRSLHHAEEKVGFDTISPVQTSVISIGKAIHEFNCNTKSSWYFDAAPMLRMTARMYTIDKHLLKFKRRIP